jgi:negative regulator of genetic competence, sporulation and motility
MIQRALAVLAAGAFLMSVAAPAVAQTTTTAPADKMEKKVEKADEKAEKKADKMEKKAENKADKAEKKAEKKADKMEKKAEKAEEKAATTDNK